MKTVYAIRDRIANDLVGNFPLATFRTDAQAVRYLADSIGQERSALGAHPNDYELIKVGSLTDDGLLFAFPNPEVVITGTALVAMMAPDGKPELVKEN